VERDIFAQCEPPGQAILGRAPFGRKTGTQRALAIGIDEVLLDLQSLQRETRDRRINAGDFPSRCQSETVFCLCNGSCPTANHEG